MDSIQEEMKLVGEQFKQRRKEMNLSLKEVENATSIRMNYLHSIEEGEVNKLISPVYAKGFVRQYASFLGMDGNAVIEEHPRIFNRVAPQEFAYGIGTLEVRGNPGTAVKWFPNAAWLLAIVSFLFFAWSLARYFDFL